MDKQEELENEKNWLARTRVDPEKFFFFYEKYYDRILGYLCRITSDRTLAEDLTSETFLKAQQNLWRFRWQGSTFGGWLYRIASNEATQHFRRHGTKTVVDGDFDELIDPDSGALSQLIAKEDLAIILAEIEKWNVVNKTVFMLRFWQGMTNGEIAKIMRLSEGAVKTKLSRSRQVLKKVLAKEFDDEGVADVEKSSRTIPDGAMKVISEADGGMEESG